MSSGVSMAGKAFSLIMWCFVIWSFMVEPVTFIKVLRIGGGLTLGAHILEVILFLTQSRYSHHERLFNSLQILLFGVFHLGTLKK